MNDLRRLSVSAIFFLVALRICIGWQLLYEGMWKFNTLNSTKPWTSEGYLKSAQGPLRGMFYSIAGSDPYELDWLDYDWVAGRWDDWRDRYLSHYPDLSDSQKSRLNRLLDGNKTYVAELEVLPSGVSLDDKKLARAISYDGDNKRLVVDGKWHLTPQEREQLYQMVPDVSAEGDEPTGGTEEERAFHVAVTKVSARQARLSFKERLLAQLKGDPNLVGAIFELRKGIDEYKEFGNFKRFGDYDKYRLMVTEYETALKKAKTESDRVHLDYSLGEIQAMRTKLIGPIKALDAELKLEARKLLTVEQLASGRVPRGWSSLPIADNLTILGLFVLGILLIIGLMTRTSAILAAVMIFSFYLVSPPWPGVPPAPGPEHSLIVNKNFIEVVALLGIAAAPSGLWFGVDGLVRRARARRAAKKAAAKK